MQYAEPTEFDYRSAQLTPPRVAAQGDNFQIERNLVDSMGRLLWAREHVGKDGEYSLLNTDVIDEHSPVAYPTYQ